MIYTLNKRPEVKIFRYCGIFKQSKKKVSKRTFEERIYKKSEEKYIEIMNIEDILKRTSIDCPLNYDSTLYKEQCFDQKLQPHYNEKNKEYQNLSFPETIEKYSRQTQILYINEQIEEYILIIKKLFIEKSSYYFEEIMQEIMDRHIFQDDKVLILSLDKMISEKRQVMDKFFNIGYLYYNSHQRNFQFYYDYKTSINRIPYESLHMDDLSLNILLLEYTGKENHELLSSTQWKNYYISEQKRIHSICGILYYTEKHLKIKLFENKEDKKVIEEQLGRNCNHFGKIELMNIYRSLLSEWEKNKKITEEFKVLMINQFTKKIDTTPISKKDFVL